MSGRIYILRVEGAGRAAAVAEFDGRRCASLAEARRLSGAIQTLFPEVHCRILSLTPGKRALKG